MKRTQIDMKYEILHAISKIINQYNIDVPFTNEQEIIIQVISDQDIYYADVIDKAIFRPLSIKPYYKEDIEEFSFKDVKATDELQQAYAEGFDDFDEQIGNDYVEGSIYEIAWMKGNRDRLNDEISKLENALDGDEPPVIEEQPFRDLLQEYKDDQDMDFYSFCIKLHELNPYPLGYEHNIFKEFLNDNINNYVNHSNENAFNPTSSASILNALNP